MIRHQPADHGGIFQMSANTRSASSENYQQVRDVLLGRREDTIVSIDREPGALCIFKGCHSLHRVSPVVGDQLRMMGVFVYEFSPGIGETLKLMRLSMGHVPWVTRFNLTHQGTK